MIAAYGVLAYRELGPRILLLTAFLFGCGKSAAPPVAADGYGYEYTDEPLPDAAQIDANLQAPCARAPCPQPNELETPAGRVRLDRCGECPAPYVCYLDPLADLRRLP